MLLCRLAAGRLSGSTRDATISDLCPSCSCCPEYPTLLLLLLLDVTKRYAASSGPGTEGLAEGACILSSAGGAESRTAAEWHYRTMGSLLLIAAVLKAKQHTLRSTLLVTSVRVR